MDNSSSDHQPAPSRDYKCPCGKTYLSYPAIFTHIKQKHDGKVIFILYSPLVRLKNLNYRVSQGGDHLFQQRKNHLKMIKLQKARKNKRTT